jgi:hypothetical protein
MSQLDGITAKREPIFPKPVPTPREEVVVPKISSPRPQLRVPSIHIPVSAWVVTFIVTAGFLLIQPAKQLLTAEASTISTAATTHAPEPPISFNETDNRTQKTDQVIVIDQPTSTSIAQPDTEPIPATTADTPHVLPTVRILNGGATVGKASEIKKSLETLHYHVLSIGSAQFTYVQTTIYYLGNNKASAKVIAEAIGQDNASLTEDLIASPADVLVVLGTDAP